MKKFNCGIYIIINLRNNRAYIGQSINLYKRERGHFLSLKRGKHKNYKIQIDFNIYGVENFIFKVLIYCEEFELTKYEQWFCDALNPYYNICMECVDSTKGYKHTEEYKKRSSESRKGIAPIVMTEEIKKKISDSHKGMVTYWPTEETKEKCRIGSTGRNLSDESKKKVGDSKKGIPRLEETKRKISESRKGKYGGENNPYSKLTEKDVIEIKKMLKDKIFIKYIAEKFNVSDSTISAINTGKIWKGVK